MKDIRHVVTHRCNELLRYNNENKWKPCAIHFDKWFSFEDKPREWILKSLESDLDYDVAFMINVAVINNCPFCGEKLIPPLTLVTDDESEQNE